MLMSEATLEASFIHPFLQAMFSSTIPLKIAYCCNLICHDSPATRSIRPDYTIDVYNNRNFAFSNRVGEIKLSNVAKSGQQLDFYRTAIFAKERLDRYGLEMSMGIQVIGSSISFFGMNLFFDKLYTYTEL
ncbi:hypothetical protein AB4K20DRAFT_1918239 [Rhizopus microsporus]